MEPAIAILHHAAAAPAFAPTRYASATALTGAILIQQAIYDSGDQGFAARQAGL
jgi:hypothetical protein